MTDTWAAKVAAEVNDRAITRLQALPDHAGRPAWDQIVAEEITAAIARMGAGDGLVDRAEAFMATVKDYNYRTSDIEASPALITDLLARIAALTAQNNGLQACIEQLQGPLTVAALTARAEAAEAERDALRERVARLEGALRGLHHAVCGETGFAACVRLDSGRAYPWPALDAADDAARAALSDGGKDG